MGHVGLRSALSLADSAVQLQSALSLGGECRVRAFTECARSLRRLPPFHVGRRVSCPIRGLSAGCLGDGSWFSVKGWYVTTLLACFSFLEESQELLLTQQKVRLYNN